MKNWLNLETRAPVTPEVLELDEAIWIFDQHYKVPVFLSVASFDFQSTTPVRLVFCGEDEGGEIEAAFRQLVPDLRWEVFQPGPEALPYVDQPTILNRLARMQVLENSPHQTVALVDGDTAFSYGFTELDGYLLKTKNPLNEAVLWGVTEYPHLEDAWLYFRADPKTGLPLTAQQKANIWEAVIGPYWRNELRQPQANNGFLIFHQPSAFIPRWREFYLRGLEHPAVNPADDQVPLALASKFRPLPYKFNSLGRSPNQQLVFHAWADRWKLDLKRLLQDQKASSGYGWIVSEYLGKLPAHWKDTLVKEEFEQPEYYALIQGFHDYRAVYRETIQRLEKGTMVEVGTYMGRNACYAAEWLEILDKNIRFETIDHYLPDDIGPEMTQQNLAMAGVDNRVRVRQTDALEAANFYKDESLDLVVLDTDANYSNLLDQLKAWYPKVRPGALLCGLDTTIPRHPFAESPCATWDFCRPLGLCPQTDRTYFFITKPLRA